MKGFFYRLLLKLDKEIQKAKVYRVKSYLKQCGDNVKIESSCFIFVPQRLKIGSNTSISSYTTIYATYGVEIGDNCLISSNCGISSYNHVQVSYNRIVDVDKDKLYSKSVSIGNNVWIGMNACILPGVKVGNNSIIAAGSVVTKDIPANEIWAGNPARFLKKIDYDNYSDSHL